MKFILMQLGLFTAKTIILVIFILLLLAGILALLSKGRQKNKGHIEIKSLNKEYENTANLLLEEILPKDQFKKHAKQLKNAVKSEEKKSATELKKNIFIIDFNGDIRASAVTNLREEVTAILSVAKTGDEVFVRLESGGGMVHAYGLAASQLDRIRQKNIFLTVAIDKVAASGGYLMASVANTILAAPFSIIGSIGVIIQLPNFHRLLKENNIDFEQLTAGEFKRTLTVFGQNTPEAREKLRQEIEEVHTIFKNHIKVYRPEIDINKVSTGEHWLGSQALDLKLVDNIQTSDDYLYAKSREANLYEIHYDIKKSFMSKITGTMSRFLKKEEVNSFLPM